jgi:hypothetical protein
MICQVLAGRRDGVPAILEFLLALQSVLLGRCGGSLGIDLGHGGEGGLITGGIIMSSLFLGTSEEVPR